MSSGRRALLAADGGPGIGLGHVQRTLALAEWGADGVERLHACARVHEGDLLVIDTYRLPPTGQAALHVGPFTLAVIDDLGGSAFACDVIINGGAPGATLSYPPAGPRLLLGPEYALLGPAFWERPARAAAGEVARILVTAGGSPSGPFVAGRVQLLVRLPSDVSLDVVVGPFGDVTDVRAAAAGARGQVRVHTEVPTLRDLALRADLAVSAAGHTLLELAWAGCPVVDFALVANQEPRLAAMTASGIVRSVGRREDAGLLNPRDRATMATAGRRLVDGRGALRVARVLGALGRLATTSHTDGETA